MHTNNRIFRDINQGDASSPHGATCIQFNSGDGSKPSSPSSPAGAGNEGLTRQQLDLISQIMQQTKQANAGINGGINGGSGSTSGQKQAQRPRTWNMQVSSSILCMCTFVHLYMKMNNVVLRY